MNDLKTRLVETFTAARDVAEFFFNWDDVKSFNELLVGHSPFAVGQDPATGVVPENLINVETLCVENSDVPGDLLVNMDPMSTVYRFTQGDEVVYIKFLGQWRSHEGGCYSDFTVVTPVEKTIILYGASEE